MANNKLAYGFVTAENLFAQRVSEVGQAEVFTMIQESFREHTIHVNALFSRLVERTVLNKINTKLVTGKRLQPLGPSDQPRVNRPSGSFDVAFPVYHFGDAWGGNRIALATMTVEEANRITVEMIDADRQYLDDSILSAMFDNVAYTFKDDRVGDLEIEPLANGDVTFSIINGQTEASQHYLFQSGSIADGSSTNPFPTIYTQLTKHPSNLGGDIVAYIPSGLKSAVEALTSFHGIIDARLSLGSAATTLNVTDAEKTAIRGPGGELLGRADKVWIVLWDSLPSGYILAHSLGADINPVGHREFPETSLQGFHTEEGSFNGNLKQTNAFRDCGFGVMNRIAAVAMQISNGSYSIPSGFNTPIGVN